jgi:hypothetical protein
MFYSNMNVAKVFNKGLTEQQQEQKLNPRRKDANPKDSEALTI